MIDELKKQLATDEGRVKYAYPDSEGYWTIGIGCLIDQRRGGGLRDNEIDFIFNNRVSEKMFELAKRVPWSNQLDEVRRAALINMCFQMGVDGLLGFPHMLQSLQAKNYQGAHDECLNSAWHKQTPARCERVAKQILTGEWQWQ